MYYSNDSLNQNSANILIRNKLNENILICQEEINYYYSLLIFE